MPKGNVFGKPSAEPNLFELCRGEKTCPKGTFPASRAQSQAMLELCRGEKTCPKGTFPASRAQSQDMLELCRGEKTCPERTISLPRQKQSARHTLQARPTDPVQIIRNIVLPIYILDVPASLDLHPESCIRLLQLAAMAAYSSSDPPPNPRLRQGLLTEIRQKRNYSIVGTTWYIIVLF